MRRSILVLSLVLASCSIAQELPPPVPIPSPGNAVTTSAMAPIENQKSVDQKPVMTDPLAMVPAERWIEGPTFTKVSVSRHHGTQLLSFIRPDGSNYTLTFRTVEALEELAKRVERLEARLASMSNPGTATPITTGGER